MEYLPRHNTNEIADTEARLKVFSDSVINDLSLEKQSHETNLSSLSYVEAGRSCFPQLSTGGVCGRSLLTRFLLIMDDIRQRPDFAQIYADDGTLNFNVRFQGHPKNRSKNLRTRMSRDWGWIENASGAGMLLIPPEGRDSKDISDFARKYPDAAEELFTQIEKHASGYRWIYSEGTGEDILHIRFENGEQPRHRHVYQ